jgi:hypothetical protein
MTPVFEREKTVYVLDRAVAVIHKISHHTRTISMKPGSPLEAKYHYLVPKSPPLVSVMGQLYPVHTLNPLHRRYIIILPFHLRLRLPSGLFPLGFLRKLRMHFSSMPTTHFAVAIMPDTGLNSETLFKLRLSFDWDIADILKLAGFTVI